MCRSVYCVFVGVCVFTVSRVRVCIYTVVCVYSPCRMCAFTVSCVCIYTLLMCVVTVSCVCVLCRVCVFTRVVCVYSPCLVCVCVCVFCRVCVYRRVMNVLPFRVRACVPYSVCVWSLVRESTFMSIWVQRVCVHGWVHVLSQRVNEVTCVRVCVGTGVQSPSQRPCWQSVPPVCLRRCP